MTQPLYCAVCGARLTRREPSRSRAHLDTTGKWLTSALDDVVRVCSVRCAEKHDRRRWPVRSERWASVRAHASAGWEFTVEGSW